MDLADEAVARLNRLALLNDGNLVLMVRDLIRSAVASAPSCLAVIITLGDEEPLYAIDDRLRAGNAVVRASLRAQITESGPGHPMRHVVFLAEQAGEFEDLTAMPLPVIGLPEHQWHHLVIDGDLSAATTLIGGGRGSDIDPGRLVNRAIGVMLDRGFPPDEAFDELRSQAQATGHELAEHAQLILSSLA
jgi:hypothetical protein